ncbi:MAG: Gfo/Idh/MocA family oxidoreductase [Acidobacteriaceae bacterium]|nr:Gfo/Idh/MocA family oxidoreductase [Acidobacteriaceae bacterium]MBV9779897.1 Gfo/Idh/MocA family oxidoreductase [Acidobacteriaceae bacterium]
MSALRVAVIGAGSFGRQHVRAIKELAAADLVAIVDIDVDKAQQLATEFGSHAYDETGELLSKIDAAIIATPTFTHEQIATRLLEAGIDLLVEKPIADTSAAGERLARLAERKSRILQAGHLERFNPAVKALEQALTVPLFFEVHRLSTFTPRSLDIDVILDLMIHDLDIVLSFMRETPAEIHAAGISVLSPRVDIANVRLSFPSGCVANLTASRVSTEKVRKLRLFQPGEYISLDYQRQDAFRVAVRKNEPNPATGEFVSQNSPQFDFSHLPVERGEPLKLELAAFFAAVRDRTRPPVDGFEAANTLRIAEAILDKIREHAELVAETLRRP